MVVSGIRIVVELLSLLRSWRCDGCSGCAGWFVGVEIGGLASLVAVRYLWSSVYMPCIRFPHSMA